MKTRDVTVHAATGPSGTVEFQVDGVQAEHARLKLDPKSGEHRIHFHLDDHSGLGLSYDEGDPIWVGENCPCPPPSGVNSDQIGSIDCNSHLLSAVNANSGAARELRYQLNFTAKDGSSHSCDPIIENGGSNLV